MNKKPHYRQSAIVFLLIGLIFFLNGLDLLLNTSWIFYAVIGIVVSAVLFAIISGIAIAIYPHFLHHATHSAARVERQFYPSLLAFGHRPSRWLGAYAATSCGYFCYDQRFVARVGPAKGCAPRLGFLGQSSELCYAVLGEEHLATTCQSRISHAVELCLGNDADLCRNLRHTGHGHHSRRHNPRSYPCSHSPRPCGYNQPLPVPLRTVMLNECCSPLLAVTVAVVAPAFTPLNSATPPS